MKRTAIILLTALLAAACSPSVSSPDGRIKVKLEGDSYSVSYKGRTVLEKSVAELVLSDGRSFGTSSEIVTMVKQRKQSISVDAPLYRQSRLEMTANILTVEFGDNWGMDWFVCNEGAAYRFHGGQESEMVEIKDEIADFNFAEDGEAVFSVSTNKQTPYAISFENIYTYQMLSEGQQAPAFMPYSVKFGETERLTILESDQRAYPGMFLRTEPGTTCAKAEFAPYPKEFITNPVRCQRLATGYEEFIAKGEGFRTYPWRIMAISSDDTQMPVNNMVYALAEPCRLDDVSWIKPGFIAWDWWNDWGLKGVDFEAGINTRTYKYYIDFASANGFEYIVLDEGWSKPSEGDVMSIIPEIDLEEIVSYAAERNVKVVLWVVFNVLDDKLEAACEKYSQMGIAGFKVDFLDRNDQDAVEMIWRVADAAARHNMIVDYHGIFPPTGMNRAYPNVVNFEAVHGEETFKWISNRIDKALYLATIPYLRQMCGYMDYTPGGVRNVTREAFVPNYREPTVVGTRAHEVALYPLLDSPFTMLSDSPTAYEAEQETTDFIAGFPRSYEQTLCLAGKLGEYVVIARRAGSDWFVGGITNGEARTIDVPMDFLGKGSFEVRMMKDTPESAENACAYAIDEMTLEGKLGNLTIEVAPAGGFAMQIINKQ